MPHFKERGSGHLINISSFLGRVPLATVRSVYSAAKAALNSLTAAVVKLIEEPVAEIYTNPASPEIARRYYEDIGAFETRMAGI